VNTAVESTAPSSLTSHVRSLVDEDWIDFAISHVVPTFSLTRTKVKVVAISSETEDAIRIELEPNKNWKGHRPGQFVLLKVNIGGIIHERCYSLISAPSARTIALAVKRQPGGLVSNWLNDSLRVGDVLEVGTAAGEFCFAEAAPERLFLIAGGSGVTPIYSLASAALRQRPDADIVLVYYARSPTDFILARPIEELAAKYPRLRVAFYVDGAVTGEGYEVRAALTGRFCEAHVAQLVPDVDAREIYVCGPPGLMNAVSKFCDANGHADRLHRESFGPTFSARAPGDAAEVSFAKTGLTTTTSAPTLLAAAEEAGLRPAFGCRMGICHTCTCTKVSGVVRDLVTGAIDDAPGSRIRICVSEPVSAVQLDL